MVPLVNMVALPLHATIAQLYEVVTTEDLVEEILGDIHDERDEDIHAWPR